MSWCRQNPRNDIVEALDHLRRDDEGVTSVKFTVEHCLMEDRDQASVMFALRMCASAKSTTVST
jgi:hypothetical protein